ncbi:hypothetical protein KMW28_00390 [Flammeovirga yaeyamensis]|uniref:Uncharacterized protein n=1 Tax=Flammeovirga yaeyamensis TaxID=367791 RepID=A0AAX1N3F7_9BACT|nr:hypothetical protein [Flammeovirga yaeyamensis]MBB3700658.1 hypothetical protein [Flammeovirga yaeyamensis]NMF37771.1 hypothetical protein [Flammeovirga yaeyamensis]QWG02079.1 hypothetical protein KMW28_00390 [Flammeovirga yaeyamensis]
MKNLEKVLEEYLGIKNEVVAGEYKPNLEVKATPTKRYYDPTNVGIESIEKGGVIKISLEDYTITKKQQYEWDDNFIVYEFVGNHSEGVSIFHHIEIEHQKVLLNSKPIRFFSLKSENNIQEDITLSPIILKYNDQKYDKIKTQKGILFSNSNNTQSMMTLYQSLENENEYLLLFKNGSENYSAYLSEKIKDSSINLILPRG